MKKIGVLLFVLILPAMLFARGGQAADENYLRFAWWGNTTRDQRTVEVVRLFEQRNPGVTIETEAVGWGGYFERMNTMAAAGSLPDVMQQDVSQIKGWSDRNLLEDLAPFAQRGGLLNLANWDDAGLAPGRLNGKLVGLLLGTNALTMVVDPEILQQAGVTLDDTAWTWANYETIATQIFRNTGIQTMPIIINIRQTIEHISRQLGAPLFTADERQVGIAVNQEALNALRSFLEMQMRLVSAGVIWDPEDGAISSRAFEEFPFGRGRTWNDVIWSNQYTTYANIKGRPLRLVMFPSVAAPKAPFGNYMRPSMFISMLSASGNKNLSARFINFFSNDLDANRILLAERGVPIPTDVRADLFERVDAHNRVIFEFINRIGPFASPSDAPPPVAGREVELAMQATLLQLLTNRINLDAAMNQLVQGSNAILQR